MSTVVRAEAKFCVRGPQRLLGECGPSGSDWGLPGTSAGGGSEDGDRAATESSSHTAGTDVSLDDQGALLSGLASPTPV